MPKFCGKCGSPLDGNGKCPKCDYNSELINNSEAVNSAEPVNNSEAVNNSEPVNNSETVSDTPSQQQEEKIQNISEAPAELSKKEKREAKKAERKQIKKEKKKAERASWSVGKKIRRFLFKWIAILLAIAILIGAGAGALVYFGFADIPFISNVLDFVGLSGNKNSSNNNFSIISGKFTDIKITDETSAIKAAQEVSNNLNLSKDADELSFIKKTSSSGLVYYRLQQNHNSIPVYNKTVVVVSDLNGNAVEITSNTTDNLKFFDSVKCSKADVEKIVGNYFVDHFGEDYKVTQIEESNDQNYIFYQHDNHYDLSYISNVNFSSEYGQSVITLIINLVKGVVEQQITQIQYDHVTCYGPSETAGSFIGLKNTDNSYIMKDVEKNIYIYSANKQTVTDLDTGATYKDIAEIVESNDEFFGNQDDLDKEYDKAFELLKAISNVYNYYYKNYNDTGLGVILGVYNDQLGKYAGNNAAGGIINLSDFTSSLPPECNEDVYNGRIGYLSIGTQYCNDLSAHIDLIAHEYTHFISRGWVNWPDNGDWPKDDQPGAINEGYSDIFGEIIESAISGNNPDWNHNSNRDIATPSKSNHPAKINDKKIEKFSNSQYGMRTSGNNYTDYSHGYSTIISHAAYLMVNGSSNTTLNIKELSDIWYNTMLIIPSDCTFIQLRECMELTANLLDFSNDEKDCISAAFDEVGICYDGEYSLDTAVSVIGKNGENYDNYTIVIDGKQHTGWLKLGLIKSDFHKEIKVTKANPYTLNLEKGDYNITIKDNDTGEMSVTFSIKARRNATNNNLKFFTYFGKDKIDSNYSPVITQYQDAITNDYYADSQYGFSDDVGEYVNHELLDCARNYDEFHTYYALIDINSDGTEECIIGAGKDPSSIENYDIFTHDGSAPKPLFNVGTFGDRTSFSVSEDGIIRTFDSGWEYSYYRLPKLHAYVEQIERIFKNYGLYYRSYYGSRYEISEEEYNNIIYKYDRLNSAKLNWIEIIGESSERATSSEREIVLVLDVSGSMSGSPLEETKKASDKFVETILKEDACIGVVTYANRANMDSDFSMNETALKRTVGKIGSGGGTNIESGLQMAADMLESSDANKKIIVLMSDGEPNEGKTGDELIYFADEIKKNDIYIYTLGFFEDLGSYKSSAQELMESLASDGCHYEVSSADDLVFFFGDIADQISGQKYIYVRIACPVDVTVTQNGQTLCSEEDNLSTRTDFGSLTFEENKDTSDPNKDNRIKVLRLKDGTNYDIRIEGNGRGKMNYTIGFMDDAGEYSDLRKFTNIKITKNTVIDTVAKDSSSSVLKVDEDGDGKYDLTYKAKANSRGELVDYTYLYYICGGAVALILILICAIKIKKNKKTKVKEN